MRSKGVGGNSLAQIETCNYRGAQREEEKAIQYVSEESGLTLKRITA